MTEEKKESSVLFSLQELFNLEQDRIKQEEDAKQRAAEDDARAKQEAEQRARQAEEARVHEEEEKRRLEEQRKREEAARLEAMRQAEIEKAKVESEQKARIAALKQQQEHEMELAKLKQDKHKRNLTIGITVVVGVLVIGGSAGGFMWHKSAVEAEQKQQVLEAEKARQAEEMKKLQARLEEQSNKVDELVNKMAAAQSDAERARINEELRAAQAEKAKLKGQIGGGAKKESGGGGGPKQNCAPGDPMCGM